MWHTAGAAEYNRLRPLSYPDTTLFLFLFSVVDRESFRMIETQFLPEVLHFNPHAPRLLIGNMTDLPNHKVSQEEAETFAQQFKFVGYVALSVLNKSQLDILIKQAARFASIYDPKLVTKSNKCALQ